MFSKLTINSIAARAVLAPMPRPVRTAAGDILAAPLALVDVHTNEGIVGRGYAFADPLHVNQDGSVDLYIQVEAPDPENEPNWLPVTTAPFTLLMRLYSPREQVLTRAWSPPPLQENWRPIRRMPD
jgi:L-alanine-DL-glutamate epimerase-like enolase superfamily enzyme